MVLNTWRRGGFAALLTCLLVCSCKDEIPACYDLDVGQKLEIEIVERYDDASQFAAGKSRTDACEEGFDLTPGATLSIEVQRQALHEVNDCKSSFFTVENGDTFGWQITRSINEGRPIPPLVADVAATVGGCEAIIQLAIDTKRSSEDLFAVSEVGQQPYFVLQREFLPLDGCSRAYCADDFVVTIRSVQ